MMREGVMWGMCKIGGVLLLLFGVFCFPGVGRCQDDTGTFSVVGTVVNATDETHIPVGETVTLAIFSETGQQLQTYTVPVDEMGDFRFENLVPNPDFSFVTRITYQDITYTSNPARLTSRSGRLSPQIVIYDATGDPGDVVIEHLHLFITPSEEYIQVTEHYVVGLESRFAYAGYIDAAGRQVTLDFPLPPGAVVLRDEDALFDDRFLVTGNRIADTHPVLPGSTGAGISFSYEIPYASGQPITRSSSYPVAGVTLVVDGPWQLSDGAGAVLSPATPAVSPATYQLGPFDAGEVFQFYLEPLWSLFFDTASVPSSGNPPAVILAVPVLSLAAFAGYCLWWRSTRRYPAVPEAVRPLIADMAELDNRFAKQEIDADAYRQQREVLKTRIQNRIREELLCGELHQ